MVKGALMIAVVAFHAWYISDIDAVHMVFFRSDFSILGKWACPVYALLTVALFVLTCILVEFAIGAVRKRKQGKEQAA